MLNHKTRKLISCGTNETLGKENGNKILLIFTRFRELMSMFMEIFKKLRRNIKLKFNIEKLVEKLNC